MTELLSVPLKKPTDLDLVRPLVNLIKSSYNNLGISKLSEIEQSISKFNQQRNASVWKAYEKSENSLELYYTYYDQLSALETKIIAQDLQVPFKWKDAFDKGSIFGGRMSLTLSSLAYEKICVLFNIAALQSSLAAMQNLNDDDGLKMAAKLFQLSAGIFFYLKSAVPAAISQEPTLDLSSDVLCALNSLMLAQAQEIFVFKAIKDSMKDLVIAKLCCQCEDMYSETLKMMQKDSIRSLWDRDWIPVAAGKQAGFHALTMFYSSLVAKAKKAVGEEISQLQKAVELFKISQSRIGNAKFLDEYLSKANKNLSEAKKDNDFIYNETIPDINSLPAPGKAQLAKNLPLSSVMSANFKDIFAELTPLVLYQSMTASETRKNEIINGEIMKLREATQSLNTLLSSYNLPAAVETTVSGSALPPSLLGKAKDVYEKGGVNSLHKMIKELPELLKRNKEILDEAERMLVEESSADEQLRMKFAEQWTRTPSSKLTQTFLENCATYRKIIDNAINADKTVREKFEQNREGIEILSMTEDELAIQIPSGFSKSDSSNSSAAQHLTKLMESVNTIKAERDVVESELRSATIDLKKQFLAALAADGIINEPAISMSEIRRVLTPLQNQVQDNLSRQEILIQDIKETHQKFVSETGSSGASNDQLFTKLAVAYDVFTELQKNLQDGVKFYNDLTQLLIIFQNKISDYCFARKTEKEELMKDLTQQASQAQSAFPSFPAHMASTSSTTEQITAPTATIQTTPYPIQSQVMPLPYGSMPYPTYASLPMPQGFNPYATLPYPNNYQSFPQVPNAVYYTYPGSASSQQHAQNQPQ